MPPPIAFLLCLTFVIYLLRLDHKISSDISSFIWIPSIWAIVYFGRGFGAWFGIDQQSTLESGSPYDRIFLVALTCVAVIILLRRGFDWPKAIKENKWLIFLVGFMFISILWSPFPYISFKRWTRELIAVIMAFALLSERNPQQAVLSVLRRVSYVLIPFSVLLVKYYPEYGVEYNRWEGSRMWKGVATQKNGLTRLCIVVAIFLVWSLIKRRRGHNLPFLKAQTYADIVILLLSFFLLIGPYRTLTYSATSMVTFVAAIITLCGIYWMKKRGSEISAKALRAIIIIIIIYGTITPFIGKLSILDISSIVKRDSTLTDRNIIWKRLVPLALNRPIIGHGYGGFWTTEMRLLTDAHAHNGYLDIILNIGFFGLMFVSVFLLSCCRKAGRAIKCDFEWGTLFICYLIMLVVFSIAEASIDSLTGSLTAIVMFFSVCSVAVSKEKERIAS